MHVKLPKTRTLKTTHSLSSRTICTMAVAVMCYATKKIIPIMLHEGKIKPNLREMNINFKNLLYFLVEFRPLFLKSFQGLRMKFQSHRLDKLQTKMYVTADLYHAQWPDNARII